MSAPNYTMEIIISLSLSTLNHFFMNLNRINLFGNNLHSTLAFWNQQYIRAIELTNPWKKIWILRFGKHLKVIEFQCFLCLKVFVNNPVSSKIVLKPAAFNRFRLLKRPQKVPENVALNSRNFKLHISQNPSIISKIWLHIRDQGIKIRWKGV